MTAVGPGFTSSEAIEMGNAVASAVVLIYMREQKAFVENEW